MAAGIRVRKTGTRNRSGSISPQLAGDILLTLSARAARGDAPDGVSAAHELAEALRVSEGQARQAAQALLRAGCLRQRRVCVEPHAKTIRYVQGYALPPAEEERGLGRRPRLRPLGLIAGAQAGEAEHEGALLRRDGYLPLAVPTGEAACTLLEHLAFELVVVLTSEVAGVGLPAQEAARVERAARAAGCGSFLVVNAGGDVLPLP